jgi:hypothetical protein
VAARELACHSHLLTLASKLDLCETDATIRQIAPIPNRLDQRRR